MSALIVCCFPSLGKGVQRSLKKEKGAGVSDFQCNLIYCLYLLFIDRQTESAGIQRAQIQKELWRIQDVMEGLSKHKQQRSSSEAGTVL